MMAFVVPQAPECGGRRGGTAGGRCPWTQCRSGARRPVERQRPAQHRRVFLAITGLTVKDFHLLVRLKVFNTEQMNQAVFAFRRYEDASLRYTGIDSHEGLTHYGLYDTVVARD
jgi:hypothetical protein